MSPELTQTLPDEARLALAYTPEFLRGPLRIFFEFDARLARLVTATSEPMLGQVRLAWWRDTLGMAVSERPRGDEVLDAIGQHWVGAEDALVALVNGWENMLTEPPMSKEAVLAFADGRGQALAGLNFFGGGGEATVKNLRETGRLWALADAASHLPQGGERDIFVSLGLSIAPTSALAAPYKGVAVLAALAVRSIQAGGKPLMAGRGAALVALRAGILGR
ncbi:MAG: hypothetical protein AAF692_05950 [Pseudomonadota bacterium]